MFSFRKLLPLLTCSRLTQQNDTHATTQNKTKLEKIGPRDDMGSGGQGVDLQGPRVSRGRPMVVSRPTIFFRSV